MTVLAPTAWWRGLGGLTRSGSSIEALAWALYDFANTIFSFAIVQLRDEPVGDPLPRRGRRHVLVHRGGQRLGPHQRRRLADPRRDERPGRPAQAVPRLLHRRVHRRDGGHRPRRHPARPGRLRRRQLRVPGRAHLLRRAAARRRAADRAGTPLRASASRSATAARSSSAGCCSLGISTDADGESTPATFALVAGLFAVFAGAAVPRRHRAHRAGSPFSAVDAARFVGAAGHDRSATPATRRGSCGSSSRGSSTPTR